MCSCSYVLAPRESESVAVRSWTGPAPKWLRESGIRSALLLELAVVSVVEVEGVGRVRHEVPGFSVPSVSPGSETDPGFSLADEPGGCTAPSAHHPRRGWAAPSRSSPPEGGSLLPEAQRVAVGKNHPRRQGRPRRPLTPTDRLTAPWEVEKPSPRA